MPARVNIDHNAAWRDRSSRYRRARWWCEICEVRPTRWLRRPIWMQTHHRAGIDTICDPGAELDHELMTVCPRCHQRITNLSDRMGRADGARDRRTGRRLEGREFDEADNVWRATVIEHRRGFWRRACRRLLPLRPIAGRPR